MLILMMLSICFVAESSKLSHFFHKQNEKERAAAAKEQEAFQRQTQEDMQVTDMTFRFIRRYTNEKGEPCRDYDFRSRKNPFLYGTYHICNQG